MKFEKLTRIELLGFSLLLFVFAFGIYFSNTDADYFYYNYVKEDGAIENGTAVMLFCISFLLFFRLVNLRNLTSLSWKIGVIGMSLLFFFGAGEEISWGQRIFGIESSQYFIENNAQKETNLHNLVVGETKINKLVFSQILTVVLIIYLLLLPLLFRKFQWAKNLVNMFGVPIAKWSHIGAFIAITSLLFLIPSEKKWELYELAFGIIFFLIFINPVNKYIYQKK